MGGSEQKVLEGSGFVAQAGAGFRTHVSVGSIEPFSVAHDHDFGLFKSSLEAIMVLNDELQGSEEKKARFLMVSS
jgi:hypothetical protein